MQLIVAVFYINWTPILLIRFIWFFFSLSMGSLLFLVKITLHSNQKIHCNLLKYFQSFGIEYRETELFFAIYFFCFIVERKNGGMLKKHRILNEMKHYFSNERHRRRQNKQNANKTERHTHTQTQMLNERKEESWKHLTLFIFVLFFRAFIGVVL